MTTGVNVMEFTSYPYEAKDMNNGPTIRSRAATSDTLPYEEMMPGVQRRAHHVPTHPTSSTWDQFRKLASGNRNGVSYRAGQTRANGRTDPAATSSANGAGAHGFNLIRGRMKVTDDYYLILGVQRNATTAQLERAYRRYVWKVHPDRFHRDPVRREECERKLKTANIGMGILRHPALRAEYDSSWLYA